MGGPEKGKPRASPEIGGALYPESSACPTSSGALIFLAEVLGSTHPAAFLGGISRLDRTGLEALWLFGDVAADGPRIVGIHSIHRIRETGLAAGDSEACVEGETNDVWPRPFRACAAVTLVER